MARGNDGSSDNFIDLGNITTAQFKRAETWSALSFFNIASSSSDDSAWIAKYGPGNSQFLFRTDLQAAPTNVEVHHGDDTTPIIQGASEIQLNTWYMAAAICDGTSSADDVTLYTVKMDGTLIDDGLTGDTNTDEADLSDTIKLMTRDNNSDEINGSMAHAAYIRAAITKQDVLEYLYQPGRVIAKYIGVGDGVEFYLPLGLGSPEPDFSGKGKNGTIIGSPTITDNPPVGPWYGFDLGWQGAFAAAVGDKSINVSDSIEISEAPTLLIPLLRIDVNDSVNIVENISMLITTFIDVSDSVNVADNITMLITLLIDVSDSVNIADDITMLMTSFIDVFDSINIMEDRTLSGLDLSINVNDSINIVEDITMLMTSFIDVSDSIEVLEDITVAVPGLTLEINVSDNINISETVTLAGAGAKGRQRLTMGVGR